EAARRLSATPQARTALVLASVPITIAVALATWRWIESPCIAWSRRLGRAQAVPGLAALRCARRGAAAGPFAKIRFPRRPASRPRRADEFASRDRNPDPLQGRGDVDRQGRRRLSSRAPAGRRLGLRQRVARRHRR